MKPLFDLIEPGQFLDLGAYTFDAEEIVAFASRYDPQRFHLDAKAARGSIFGGLCASGWHTVSVWMRLNVLHGRDEMVRVTGYRGPTVTFGPSPGVRDLNWLRPVYAGETVHYSSTVLSKRRSASREGWGIVTNDARAALADGTPVMSMKGSVLVPTSMPRVS